MSGVFTCIRFSLLLLEQFYHLPSKQPVWLVFSLGSEIKSYQCARSGSPTFFSQALRLSGCRGFDVLFWCVRLLPVQCRSGLAEAHVCSRVTTPLLPGAGGSTLSLGFLCQHHHHPHHHRHLGPHNGASLLLWCVLCCDLDLQATCKAVQIRHGPIQPCGSSLVSVGLEKEKCC